MAEPRLHRYEVIDRGVESEGPEKEPRTRHVAAQREREAEKAGEAEEREVGAANGFHGDAGVQRLGHANPEEIDAAKSIPRKQIRVGADGGLRVLALLAAELDLAQPLVAAELGRALGLGQRRSPRKTVVGEDSGLVQFGAEVGAHRHERMEDFPVADNPRTDNGDEAQRRDRWADEGAKTELWPDDPDAASGKEGEQRAVGQGDEAPEQAEDGPKSGKW